MESYNIWFLSKFNEFARRREEDIEEAENIEFEDQCQKRDGFLHKATMAVTARSSAEEGAEFAEEGYNAARLDSIGETVERAALIKVVQEEIRSTQTQFEQARELKEKIKLKEKVISALVSIPLTRGKIKRHYILLGWIKQQRREMIAAAPIPRMRVVRAGRKE